MPSLIQTALVGAILLVSASARADDPEPDRGPVRAEPRRWDLSFRSGWGSVLTTGQSYAGPTFGGALGFHLTRRLRLELGGVYSTGTRVTATNGVIAYRSSVDSAHLVAGIGYEITVGPIVVRPQLRAGGREVSGHVRVGTARSNEVSFYPIVGPSLALAHSFRRFFVGAEAEAFFLPTWVASPSFGYLGFVGVTL